ncbi:MAG: alpha/beta hydrolase-fold protein [Cyclobacteriaceae bacterium]
MDLNRNKTRLFILFFIALSFSFKAVCGQEASIIDSRHYSDVFGEMRNYRIFLPPGYFDNPQKRYPVIYFFHGWSQRYFGASNPYADYDKGDENNGDNISHFVSNHEVIVVKADGYNRSAREGYYVRPYNVSPVETYRQFPIYFPELVDHIDSQYNTLADREHRGISGLSMGGFMTFWIGGKYPHLLSAAGNFCGSPEFEVGPMDFPVEYRHLDMFNNYGGMKVRLHYGDKDFIRGYHEDLNRVWPQVMNDYEYQMYDAAHSTCGMSDMFNFILKAFESPAVRPEKWHHIDVYPEFSVWDYEIKSDRILPGFTVMENVDEGGFRCSVREFLPDGEFLSFVNLSVTTAPLYQKNQPYIVSDLDKRNQTTTIKTIVSDNTGRLTVALNGSAHEIGINKAKDRPNLYIASVDIDNMPWAVHQKDVTVSVKIGNKGTAIAKNVSAKLSPTRKHALVLQGDSEFGSIHFNKVQKGKNSFRFRISADTIDMVRFKLTLRDENNREWIDYFELPIKKNIPEIKNYVIADGKILTVARAGKDSITALWGNGNGDGVANPGESIVILAKDQNKLWRTDLTFSDHYINPFGINIRKSDNWSSLDHVGGSAKYDVPLIASDCPQNHRIDFMAEYWLPDYPLHTIKQGLIRITVKGKDQTPPQIAWVKVDGNNILSVKAYDGSRIQWVKATLTLKGDQSRSFEVPLKDGGIEGDQAESDNVFSLKIQDQKFGIFTVVIEAMDSSGNKTTAKQEDDFILH